MGRAYEVRKASMAKTGLKKTKVYSKYGKEIYMAAKQGLPDPEMNVGLRRIIDEARSKEVPADVIQRAIDKAKGGSEESYHSSTYEGFGPGASTIIVECLTDNDNRTVSDVRNCFTKTNSKMGVSGSVIHFYEHAGVLSFENSDEEQVMEILLMADVELSDIEVEDGYMNITVEPSHLHKAKDALENELGEFKFDVLEITYIPFEYVKLDSDEEKKEFNKLMTMLNDVEDVQNVYHNVQGADE